MYLTLNEVYRLAIFPADVGWVADRSRRISVYPFVLSACQIVAPVKFAGESFAMARFGSSSKQAETEV